MTPRVQLVRQNDTHRLIPSKYSANGDSVLVRIADDDDHLEAIFELDNATNDRLLAENNRLPGIGIDELVFGIPYFRIVNAAFCHAHPSGSRFNSPDRGAWYAGFDLETSQAEVAFHKSVELAEVDWLTEEITYDDYLADFSSNFHDIRGDAKYVDCLNPDSYLASQDLAETLLKNEALGIIYPSVRHTGGTCLACFRPALVGNVRKAKTYLFAWNGTTSPVIVEI
ncbi:RES family NAD+ phosphorylase [[Pseudomonas] carboxydohydrogena]|uniref:RES family NAD+ phosphorylase n=1 Tax=Afipia carboxydohydrogena TaxID=290 RepID=A0ABY8BQ62_AFICR|nr:RES family NAD+ phosphorylase [[Pseudomonas] carboxydohydrogena]RTL75130.1 MAG: RES domain-containing protein [Bradyrhizobiaceae bacterium]WEF51671.1 RES family NAD+ phosphorylase [[Pseudomonas] carboxydohydrogena]